MASVRHANNRHNSSVQSSSYNRDLSQIGTLRKLQLCGKNTKKLEFCYPANLDDCISQQKALKLSNRLIQRITCGIYDAIGSLQLHFKDGVDTGTFGTTSGQQLKCSLEVPEDEVITGVRIRHSNSSAAIQNITFDTDLGTEIEFNAKMSDGEWTEQRIEPGELIVGVYGCCWSEA